MLQAFWCGRAHSRAGMHPEHGFMAERSDPAAGAKTMFLTYYPLTMNAGWIFVIIK